MIRKHIILHIEIHKPKTIIPEPEFRVPECHFAIAFENNCLQSIELFFIFHTSILFLFLKLVFLSLTLISIAEQSVVV